MEKIATANLMNNIVKEIHMFSSLKQMADFAIGEWAAISTAAIKNNGGFSAALSGGKTPALLYEKLSAQRSLPWGKTHIFMVDERFVPYESDENNYHMLNRLLLRHVPIAPKNVHPILTSESLAQGSAARYEKDMISFCKSVRSVLPRFDLILLGIGEDGHTASLFPDTPALKETQRLAVCVTPPDNISPERITITFPVINNAHNIIFLAAGENKAKAVKDIVENKDSILPAAMVRPHNGKLIFILDKGAGSLLTKVRK